MYKTLAGAPLITLTVILLSIPKSSTYNTVINVAFAKAFSLPHLGAERTREVYRQNINFPAQGIAGFFCLGDSYLHD